MTSRRESVAFTAAAYISVLLLELALVALVLLVMSA